ncbi:phage tail assembly chaperone [Rahnella aceris]
MNSTQRIWPEGDQFTLEVNIPTNFESLPVLITYVVPAFDVVVETWKNKDPAKSYSLFRKFIVDWDMQDKITDSVLMSFLTAYPGTPEAIFYAWAKHMREVLNAKSKAISHEIKSIQ